MLYVHIHKLMCCFGWAKNFLVAMEDLHGGSLLAGRHLGAPWRRDPAPEGADVPRAGGVTPGEPLVIVNVTLVNHWLIDVNRGEPLVSSG